MNVFYVQQMNVKALNWFLAKNVIFVFRARSRGAFSVYHVPYQSRGGASCNNIYMPIMNVVMSRLLDTQNLSRFSRASSSSVAFKRQVR